MNVKFSQKITKILLTVLCLVLVVTFSLFNQADANALTKLPETSSFRSGISSPQTTIKSTEPTATELTKSPAITTQESFPNDLTRLLKTNECVGCNLAGAALKDTNLQAANLEGANLQGADLERANLQQTNLKGANLQGADLGKTNIAGANLANANLFDADLEKANLQGVNLEGANLEGADLEKTNLASANIQGANLKGADLEDAILPTAMAIR
ncbi:MAG: pentapeptide repeat-containing protein [Waterburya sp.]